MMAKEIGNWKQAKNPDAPKPAPRPTAPVAEAPAADRFLGAVFDTREAVATGERVTLTPEQAKARRRRSQWMALALFSFVILVFVLTMTKMGAQILVRDL
jgi:hypothetical protein